MFVQKTAGEGDEKGSLAAYQPFAQINRKIVIRPLLWMSQKD